ncbi:MAG TPA: hypothetical protein VLG49_02750 [Rhabdochlamydiaceae bacterium]|nr:hypothetical protein [Rhabdochlamydiaceae bacterium]
MKKIFISSAALLLASFSPLTAAGVKHDLSYEIPEIDISTVQGYQKVENVAEFGKADWKNVIGIARGITLSDAYKVADKNPDVTYFFYTKGIKMVLKAKNGGFRIFTNGDAVFFTDKPWWGSAPGLADGYIKQSSSS